MTRDLDQIMINALKALGYTGLVDVDDECGCSLDDFAPCGHCWCECEPGYVHECEPGGEFDFIVTREKEQIGGGE